MANFYANVSADQIIRELRDDEEEFGEVIALIAHEVAKLSGGDLEALREYIVSYGDKSDFNAMAALLTAAEAEAR